MPVDSIQTGEVFTVRSYKQYVGFSWANTYEVQATSEPINSITAIESLASAIVSLEQQLHISGVIIDRIVISTYVQDGEPYNPSSFTTIPVSLPGQRFPYTDVLPLEMALFVRRNSPTGRDGRLLYRGCLLEGDMSASAFRPLISQNAVNEFQAIFGTWFNTTFPSQQWNVVMASGPPNSLSIRQIVGFQVSERMIVKKLNNRYYDRP
jgi:hypothetical protein